MDGHRLLGVGARGEEELRALGRVGEAAREQRRAAEHVGRRRVRLRLEQHPRELDAPARARDVERGLVVAPARRVEQHVGAAVEEQAEDLRPVVHHREHHMGHLHAALAAAPLTPPAVRPESRVHRDVGEEFLDRREIVGLDRGGEGARHVAFRADFARSSDCRVVVDFEYTCRMQPCREM